MMTIGFIILAIKWP